MTTLAVAISLSQRGADLSGLWKFRGSGPAPARSLQQRCWRTRLVTLTTAPTLTILQCDPSSMAEDAPLIPDLDTPENSSSKLGWVAAGLILFGFASPSAVVGVAYGIAASGLLFGPLLNIVMTCASAAGAYFLLQVILRNPEVETLGQVGLVSSGRMLQCLGAFLQYLNFVLFLPVGMILCALALQSVIDPNFQYCTDYFLFAVAGFCFLSTQVRTLKNSKWLAYLSLLCVLVVVVLHMYVVIHYNNPVRLPPRLFGNALNPGTIRYFSFALAVTISSWSYVPSFLITELSHALAEPRKLQYSIGLSAALNVALFLLLGVSTAQLWGGNLQDPITTVSAWPVATTVSRVLNAFLLVANFVSYCLDSVPLTRACQQWWMPKFRDDWSVRSVLLYAMITLPTWLVGLLLAFFVPNLFVMLAWVTAITTPWATQIYPAVVYWCWRNNQGPKQYPGVQPFGAREKALVALVLIVGVLSFLICAVAAFGKSAIPALRGPSYIGCPGWF